jgi:hypothetical protein
MCHHWVTHSRMKLVWEKGHHLQVEIDIADLPVRLARERDSWLMQELVCMDYNCDDLQRLNPVREHQNVLFLLDVMDASSQAINKKYLDPRPMGEAWLSLTFPIRQPSIRDFRLWKTAIPQIQAPGGRLHLGNYTEQGHKIWAWQYNLDSSILYHYCKDNLMDIYEPSRFPGARTWANRYSCT